MLDGPFPNLQSFVDELSDRYKEQRRIISLKNLMESRWAILDHQKQP